MIPLLQHFGDLVTLTPWPDVPIPNWVPHAEQIRRDVELVFWSVWGRGFIDGVVLTVAAFKLYDQWKRSGDQ